MNDTPLAPRVAAGTVPIVIAMPRMRAGPRRRLPLPPPALAFSLLACLQGSSSRVATGTVPPGFCPPSSFLTCPKGDTLARLRGRWDVGHAAAVGGARAPGRAAICGGGLRMRAAGKRAAKAAAEGPASRKGGGGEKGGWEEEWGNGHELVGGWNSEQDKVLSPAQRSRGPAHHHFYDCESSQPCFVDSFKKPRSPFSTIKLPP